MGREELDAAGGMGKGSSSVSEDKARSENKEKKKRGGGAVCVCVVGRFTKLETRGKFAFSHSIIVFPFLLRSRVEGILV